MKSGSRDFIWISSVTSQFGEHILNITVFEGTIELMPINTIELYLPSDCDSYPYTNSTREKTMNWLTLKGKVRKTQLIFLSHCKKFRF